MFSIKVTGIHKIGMLCLMQYLHKTDFEKITKITIPIKFLPLRLLSNVLKSAWRIYISYMMHTLQANFASLKTLA